MNDSYNYPIGADTPEAPWNQEDNIPVKIEVTISVTLSKTVELEVSNYIVNKEEDCIDVSTCDLQKAVKEQIILPQEAYKYVNSDKSKSQLKDWIVDDFEVIDE